MRSRTIQATQRDDHAQTHARRRVHLHEQREDRHAYASAEVLAQLDDGVTKRAQIGLEHDLRCRGLRDRLLGVEEASQEGEDVDHPHGHAGHEHEHEGAHDENTPHVAKGHDPLRRVLLSDDPAEHGPEEQAEHGHERGRKAAGKRGAYRLHDGVGRERAHDEAGDEERNRHRA